MSFNPIEFFCELLYVLYSVWLKGKQIQLDLYYNKPFIYMAFNTVNWLLFHIWITHSAFSRPRWF